MSPAAERVIERLDAARQKWWLVSLLTTTILAVCVSFGTLMAFMAADSLGKFSQSVLGVFFSIWLALTLAILLVVGRRMIRGQRSLEASARRVEAEFPELESHLINLVQLAEDQKNVDRAFCEAAVRQSADRIGDLRFDRAPGKESRWRRFLYCMQTPRDMIEACFVLILLIGIAVVCEMLIPNWGSAASRLLAPWQFVPSVGAVKIVRVSPGNSDVLVGQSLDIAAEIDNPAGAPHHAVLILASEGETESSLTMTADEKYTRYQATVPSILKPFTYRLEIGDSQTHQYSVGVREKPVVESVEVTYRFPAYLGRPPETVAQQGLDLESLQYAKAEMRLKISTPVAKGYLETQGMRYLGRIDEDGRRLSVEMPLLENSSYAVRIWDDAGHGDADPRWNRISVIPDRPPSVELLKPARQSTAAPGGRVPVAIQAADDHGLGRIALEMKVRQPEDAENEGSASSVAQWTDFPDFTTNAVRNTALELAPGRIKPGQTVLIRAVAWDNRLVTEGGLDLRPQQGVGEWHAVKIIDEEAQSSAALEKVGNLRTTLFKILEKQMRARITVGEMTRSERMRMDQLAPSVADVRSRQIEIQKMTIDLADSFESTDRPEQRVIKHTLHGLALGDMLQAVGRCDDLVKLQSPEAFAAPMAELAAVQDRIIEALQKLLDVARRSQAVAMAEMKKRPGGDLPDDVKRRLEEMRKKLDEFVAQQKKVIEATENLAKTPVEDFTEEQEEALKGLAVAEDDWAKFMKDVQTDLSKLPEQDFANPSTTQELIEIQVQLKWAEDSLLKKSVDLAVPLEQLGVEMAEEMKTNIEKWLFDEPDRMKWSQEEPLTDEFKEAPMAELPGELEDMIGELAEQEEDLFDEMEDVSSSWTDSLDKGAGWDTMDGPISNMSARGVTGNAMPNTSEIGGRSGEGRQGKASGEFVGDEAIGKGGRKTPSRLTPDAFVKGQIKDHGKESPGGATGGGKESGRGGEGLEGPGQRNPGPRDAERLAGKQAALRNKAEGIDLQFQVSNFHHTDLQKMIEIMAQVERDLKAGRYQSALRQRKVLADGLSNVKQYLEGEFQVREDTTNNLPAEIQKEILGSMQDPSPSGWEKLNQDYFERLSGNGQAKEASGSNREAGKGENGE